MKSRVTNLRLRGKVVIWCEGLKNVKGLREQEFSWNKFEEYFKRKYLSEKYFHSKAKEFYELKLGHMTNNEYTTKSLEFLSYFPYLKEEKEKIQRYVIGIPQSFKDRIEFDETKTLDDAI